MVERHYCKYCNVWTQSDKQSIKRHEHGRKHKDQVDLALKRRREAKSDAATSQRELQTQLQQIEKAAQMKFEQDMARGKTRAPPPPPRRGQTNAPRPPPRRPVDQNEATPALSVETRDKNVRLPFETSRFFHGAYDAPPMEEEEESSGVYAVRGSVYLEGKKHETQLVTGSACQIWVEDVEQWLDALVDEATVHRVPNTEVSFRRFTVSYLLPAQKLDTGEQAKPTCEREVLADRLRIPLPAHMTLEAAEKMVEQWRQGDAANTPACASVGIDETTGMGEWRTVEVIQGDESPEAVAKRAEVAEAEAAQRLEEQTRLDSFEALSSQGDNALGAYNPWGGSYKGVDVEDAALGRRSEEINITTSGNVSFKKRGEKKQKRRRVHTDDE
ncbi:hypothetical protein PsorP6_014112 [Peronosclerospora sorghi]|uniref:Uncharacterized protein n=1 Tax=Peronosclerospora sorghi TaxID=230839 RepID=A0ACC0VKE0_9STRA|nr:hypothetical protein PsorP6_014112 [Peronosclerospora sorghi]